MTIRAEINYQGEMQGRPQGCDLGFLRFGLLAGRADCNESVFNLLEGREDRLLVLSQDLPGLGFDRLLLES